MPSPSAPPAPPRSGGAPSSVPAYANAPRRSGLLVALAGIVALAAAGALAIFLFGATAPPMTAASKRSGDEAQQAMAAAKAALDEASKSVLQPPSGPAPAAESPAAAPAPAAPADAAKVEPSAAPPTAPAAEAPRAEPAASPAPADKPRAVAKSEAPKSPPRAAAPPKAAPAAPEPAKVAAAPAAVAAAEAPVPDRWDQMKAEMGQCSSGSLIPRIQCEQRIRARYCDGYWGSVPACPTGRTDHGN